MIGLLVNAGVPTDCTLCDMVTEGSQVQVTVPFTATVSTAGLEVPLLSLRKKMSPNVTDAVAGACVVPPPVPPPVPGPVGLLLSPLQPASRLVASRPPTSRIFA